MTESISAARRRRRARRRRLTALGAGVVVVAAGGTAALAATGDSGPEPVTATVVTGSLRQTVEASGTVSAPTQTDAAFSADGTVDSVEVTAGEQVAKGQVLATLQTASLQSAVDSAQATVANAEQRLENDKTGQTSSGASGASGASGQLGTESAEETPLSGGATFTAARVAATAPSGSATDDQTQLIDQIHAAQQSLITAQQTVDADQAAVDAAQQVIDADVKQNSQLRDAQAAACATTGTSSADTSATPATDDCTSAQADYQKFADTLTADTTKLDDAITAQDDAITALDKAISDLDALLSTLRPSSGTVPSDGGTGTGNTGGTSSSGGTSSTGGTSSAGGGTTGSGGQPASGTGRSGSTGGTRPSGGSGSSRPSGTSGTSGTTGSARGSVPTGAAPSGSTSATRSGSSSSTQVASASQLAADQAAVDAAEAKLKVAEQDLSAATLRSPIAGTVASVGYTAGSSSRGSSITILGKGNQVVIIAVPLSQIDQVKVGQTASLKADGVTEPLSGRVTKIGLLSTTSGSLTTFPVTITLADSSPSVHDGVGADVTLTTGSADNAILVPNSAISTVGTRHLVTLVRNGKSQRTAVTIGLVGSDASQVTQGVAAGDTVQLADPSAALPASTTSSTTNRFRVGGAAGGFTFPGGARRPGG